MKKHKEKRRIFYSITDFEKEYLPKTSEKISKEKPTKARILGISLARESLSKIRMTKGKEKTLNDI